MAAAFRAAFALAFETFFTLGALVQDAAWKLFTGPVGSGDDVVFFGLALVFDGFGVGTSVGSSGSGVGDSSGTGDSEVTATVGAEPDALSSSPPPKPQPAAITSTAAAANNRTFIDEVLPRRDIEEER
ncbi:hypothetical protein GCM10023107_51400 [Actinoplanes octamycinicus]|nr:hypothetical protein Aoc01nite_04860 [Actinoplanes octamycinicus]